MPVWGQKPNLGERLVVALSSRPESAATPFSRITVARLPTSVPANTIANFAMAKMQPVLCVVRENGIAEDDSLAENDERVGLLGSVFELSY